MSWVVVFAIEKVCVCVCPIYFIYRHFETQLFCSIFGCERTQRTLICAKYFVSFCICDEPETNITSIFCITNLSSFPLNAVFSLFHAFWLVEIFLNSHTYRSNETTYESECFRDIFKRNRSIKNEITKSTSPHRWAKKKCVYILYESCDVVFSSIRWKSDFSTQ